MSTTAPIGARGRRPYIDWARGVAVLLMIEAHTFDAWTRAADKATVAFSNTRILGGFAASLFLWLAGVALVLSASSVARRTSSRAAAVDAVCRRGLEIFIIAFLFRLQAFIASPGSHPVTLFRVDILNIMGPAIAVAGIVWGVGGTGARLVLSYSALAAAVAMLTPMVRVSGLVDALPTWVQWYVRPAGEDTTFTAFPWAGFVFAGAAAGALIAAVRDSATERRVNMALAAGGVVLVAVGAYTSTLPTIYRESSFWTSSPTYFAIRVGIMMLALAVLYVASLVAERFDIALRPLEQFGRHSLFVYWIHVELVYGYASWWWRGRLPLWGTAAAYLLFTAAMYGAVILQDRVAGAWRKERWRLFRGKTQQAG